MEEIGQGLSNPTVTSDQMSDDTMKNEIDISSKFTCTHAHTHTCAHSKIHQV